MTDNLSKRDYDCIQSIYFLSSGGWPARVKDIASRLKVKPPTVVEFLDKLTKMKLVEKGPSGYKLSEKGALLMSKLTRAHRLFETLLTEVGIPLGKACTISSSVEGHIDNKTLQQLCSHLSHPETCPHGRPIPAGDQYD
ncbi:MAG: metal-dependent transcriptional regulator [Nitrososphaerota archaeon]|jgi:DtxR family Mn-dependent transcriptional regulator|nr:metal-dependent transcriptional regulator [Nitrososphaerota archaeon]